MAHEAVDNIKTIAVIDLETSDLPRNGQCAITELSVYAFSSSCFINRQEDIVLQLNDDMDVIDNLGVQCPNLPRVLHKLTMMINPVQQIGPIPQKLSGLNNDMLRNESPFDSNTANCLLNFLERLEKPICLVAHNGWQFDYPIIRYVFEAINMAIPSSVYCIDSLKAFREIDEKQQEIDQITNEMQDVDIFRYRELFSQPFQPATRYPQKGQYVLGNIYERIFHEPAEQLHCAESDVLCLTKIILRYGLVFLAYVEERKQSFNDVPRLV